MRSMTSRQADQDCGAGRPLTPSRMIFAASAALAFEVDVGISRRIREPGADLRDGVAAHWLPRNWVILLMQCQPGNRAGVRLPCLDVYTAGHDTPYSIPCW